MFQIKYNHLKNIQKTDYEYIADDTHKEKLYQVTIFNVKPCIKLHLYQLISMVVLSVHVAGISQP